MFLLGALPALLVVVVMFRLKEPERWRATASHAGPGQKLGSIAELFGTARWRRHALAGMLLAFAGVVGLWGIGFFSFDLTRSVFRKPLEKQALEQGEAARDQAFVRLAIEQPSDLDELARRIQPNDLLDEDSIVLYRAALSLRKENKSVSPGAVLRELDSEDQSPAKRERRREILTGPMGDGDTLDAETSQIASRVKAIDGKTDVLGGNHVPPSESRRLLWRVFV